MVARQWTGAAEHARGDRSSGQLRPADPPAPRLHQVPGRQPALHRPARRPQHRAVRGRGMHAVAELAGLRRPARGVRARPALRRGSGEVQPIPVQFPGARRHQVRAEHHAGDAARRGAAAPRHHRGRHQPARAVSRRQRQHDQHADAADHRRARRHRPQGRPRLVPRLPLASDPRPARPPARWPRGGLRTARHAGTTAARSAPRPGGTIRNTKA